MGDEMRRVIAGLVAAIAVGGLGATVPQAQAVEIGHEGCTPGYWKNHTDNWEEAKATTLFSSKFSEGTSGYLVGLTFEQALAGGGGPGVLGAEKILARAATAAFLNAAHEGLGYPRRRYSNGLDGRPPLVATVNAALASADRDTMLALAARLDADNNLGCPLN
ncbi:hypothetical protein GCM10009668_42850 [Nocardioides dubius]|uniref:Uncharacterized protein n=2 Tax=Nocardioides dubius TaxID=317019 RepID=A0ABN1U3R6_9ACTN